MGAESKNTDALDAARLEVVTGILPSLVDDLAGRGAWQQRNAERKWLSVWSPQPGPQESLYDCPVEDALFGGARGGGKSDALLGDFGKHAQLYGKYAAGMIVRRTMPQLEEIIGRSKQLYPALGAQWMAGTKTWTFPSGATLKMRWLERDEDADNYQGHQYTWIGIDEAGTWGSPDAIDKLRATLRSPYGVPCVMRLTANPGGPGHQWLKERYVQPADPLTPFYDHERRTWRVYIPSRVKDNRKLIEADPGYLDRLRSSGPPWLVRAWLEGDWDASAGDAFFDERCLLVEGKPADLPPFVDAVYAVIDTAVKTGSKNDGTAVVFFAFSRFAPFPLYVIDWDITQVEGALLENWLPSVFTRLEAWAKTLKAVKGSLGAWIEDKASGMILVQQARRRGLPVTAIDAKITALGKDERSLNVSGYHYQGMCKIAWDAYRKTTPYKGYSRNHFLSQVCGFRIGLKDQADDLLDCYTYSLALSFGDKRLH